eukprot:UN04720
MRKFVQKLSKTFMLSNYKAHRVVYPDVVAMEVNLTNSLGPQQTGLRHFNRDLAPAIRLANDDLAYSLKVARKDKEITQPTIDITFKDGTKSTYNALGKDSLDIYMDLITFARGKTFVQRRRLPELDTTNMKPVLETME